MGYTKQYSPGDINEITNRRIPDTTDDGRMVDFPIKRIAAKPMKSLGAIASLTSKPVKDLF